MLVHSYLYYHLDASIISDDIWQKWADELVELQKECKTIGFYDDEFDDWDGSTGCHLVTHNWIKEKAERLLKEVL